MGTAKKFTGKYRNENESWEDWKKRIAIKDAVDAAMRADPLYRHLPADFGGKNQDHTEAKKEIEVAILKRDNAGKPQLSYILEFGPALALIAQVMERGARKYVRTNWKNEGPNSELPVLLDSVMRHLSARLNGEVHDVEMYTDHLANAACGILFALYHHGQDPAA